MGNKIYAIIHKESGKMHSLYGTVIAAIKQLKTAVLMPHNYEIKAVPVHLFKEFQDKQAK